MHFLISNAVAAALDNIASATGSNERGLSGSPGKKKVKSDSIEYSESPASVEWVKLAVNASAQGMAQVVGQRFERVETQVMDLDRRVK